MRIIIISIRVVIFFEQDKIRKLTLDLVPIGKPVRMVGFQEKAFGFRHKLLAMGLTPNVVITVLCVAPLGDPVQISLRGVTLSLRKKECQNIEVEDANVEPRKSCGSKSKTDCTCRQS